MVDGLIEVRRAHADLAEDMCGKLADVDRQFSECFNSLKWYKEKVKELETKLLSTQQELCSSKDAAAANEERLLAELSKVNKLRELYKKSSEEWSRKAGELEGAIKALEVDEVDSGTISSPFSTNEVAEKLQAAKKEVEKLKEEALANKDHMLQYKNIVLVNEAALKQMECAHNNFKIEPDRLKKSLEAELLSLRERVSELEHECSMKSDAAAGKDDALTSALGDLQKEHEKWGSSQANYERQVILQTETIQELTKTSQAFASLQQEASELRKLADSIKSENDELKVKWNTEKTMLEESKNAAEKKYMEINEQLESALTAAETAQTSLNSERSNSRTMLFKEEEIKSLQFQLRESNLLHESNIQLREENKQNFEDCLKLREVAQKATAEHESSLRERERELEARKKEIEILEQEVTKYRLELMGNERMKGLAGLRQSAAIGLQS